MALKATGIGSGLDIEGLVTQLMAAERQPIDQQFFRRESSITRDISALGSLKGALAEYRSSLTAANTLATYQNKTASSSDTSSIVATATSKAALASYSVGVTNLATSQSLATRADFSSPTETVGTGTLTFTFGTTGYTADAGTPPNTNNDTYDSFTAKPGTASKVLTIDSSNNTLGGIRDAINGANFGVTAAIVKEDLTYKLLLSSDATGAENSLEITVGDSGDGNNSDASGLSRLAFNSAVGTANVYQTVEARDATFDINGLSLTSADNIVEGVIDGLSLTLKSTTASAQTISIADNKSGIKAAISAFVSGYNDFISVLNDLTAYDSTSKTSGALQGDSGTRSIASQLRAALSAASAGYSGSFSRLAEIGITTSSTGSLSIDDAKLEAAFAEEFDAVAGVLTRFSVASAGSGLAVDSFSEAVPRGTYSVSVSSLATSGKLSASIPSESFPVVINSSTDDFVVSVDGTSSGVITLANQSYSSLSAVASELQSKINSDATLRGAGKSVTVAVSGNQIEISSDSLGSGSTISISNDGTDTTLAALGLSLATPVSGTDLVGSVDGVAGTAVGNKLSGAVGTAAEGLSIEVLSNSGGSVTISDGVLSQIDSLLASLLATDNPLDNRISSLNSRAESIVADKSAAERRLASTEARYRRQFNALDILLNQLSSTGSFVAEQLANIPLPGRTNKK